MQAPRLVLALALCLHTATALLCEESGYCSVGKVQSYVGDIHQGPQLQRCLERVAYRKEVILMTLEQARSAAWLDLALQSHHELLDMGFAHHVYLSPSPSVCQELLEYDPTISCVWHSDAYPTHVLDHLPALWNTRHKFVARSVRLGYNVLCVDLDMIWLHDPYTHFKKPPLSEYQFLFTPEAPSVANTYYPNTAFLYVQNARPDGPVAWVFKNHVMSILRQADDNFTYMSQFKSWWNINGMCMNDEQLILSNALSSAAVGRLVFPFALPFCKLDATFTTSAGNVIPHSQVLDNTRALIAPEIRAQALEILPDPAWLRRTRVPSLPSPEDTQSMRGEITVPNVDLGCPEELGGRFAPTTPGPLSAEWEAQLRADCPECPWWPERRGVTSHTGGAVDGVTSHSTDPLISLLGPWFNDTSRVTKDNMDVFIDDSIPKERFAHAPRWLITSLSKARRGWTLGRAAPVQGPTVLAHVHYWPHAHRDHKLAVRKVLGRYNWTLGARVARAFGHPTPYALQGEVTKVLMLSPDVDLARTRNWTEFAHVIAGLFQVAFLSQRVLVLPSLPCPTAWLHELTDTEDTQHTPGGTWHDSPVCIPPMFWHPKDLWRIPHALPLAVDATGELIGGWARRRQRKRRHRHKHRRLLQTHEANLLEPWAQSDTTDTHTTQDHAQTQGTQDSTERQGGQSTAGGRQGGAAQTDGQGGDIGRETAGEVDTDAAGGSGEDGDSGVGWWGTQRYVALLPPTWDLPCTQDLRALILPEFFHWLKHTPTGQAARLAPTPANTVLTPDPTDTRLQLLTTTSDIPATHGAVVPPLDEQGWSLYDVQIQLSVEDVLEAMGKVADEAIVYVGHPVMVGLRQQGPLERQRLAQVLGYTKAPLPEGGVAQMSPEHMLAMVNERLRKSKCRALWVKPDVADAGKLVNLSHGVPASLIGGRIQTLPSETR